MAVKETTEEKISKLEKRLEEASRLIESRQQKIQELEKAVLDDHLAPISGGNSKEGDERGLTNRIENFENALNSAMDIVSNNANDIQLVRSDLSRIRRNPPHSGSLAERLRREVAQIKQDVYADKFREIGKDKLPIQEIMTDNSAHQSLNPLKHYNGTFCLPWEVNSDKWWLHHPDWFVSNEEDSEYCFSLMESSLKSHFFRRLYNIQFRGNCDQVITKERYNSGWGVDLAHIVDGLKAAVEVRRPFQITQEPWHYAVGKDGSRAVCPQKNMHCYFLPITRCDPIPEKKVNLTFFYGQHPTYDLLENRWHLEYAVRPQTWLRKASYDFSKTINLTSPCTVMHVRRGDIVLHEQWSRRYYPIEDYVNATNRITNNIFLLTDDKNAVKEAQTKFPGFNWVFVDRPRYKGPEGGWENHAPSDDPKQEVIVLMSIFKKVGMCDVFIHTKSNLANHIIGIMLTARNNTSFLRVNLNQGQTDSQVYNSGNSESYNISKAD
jgi:hypothetical protein